MCEHDRTFLFKGMCIISTMELSRVVFTFLYVHVKMAIAFGWLDQYMKVFGLDSLHVLVVISSKMMTALTKRRQIPVQQARPDFWKMALGIKIKHSRSRMVLTEMLRSEECNTWQKDSSFLSWINSFTSRFWFHFQSFYAHLSIRVWYI